MIAKKIWLSFPCCFDALTYYSHSLRKHFFPPLCLLPNLPRYKQRRRWRPLSTAAQACLSSVISQFFLPFNGAGNFSLSTAHFPSLMPAWRAGWSQSGNKVGSAVPKPFRLWSQGRSHGTAVQALSQMLPHSTSSCKMHTGQMINKSKSATETETLRQQQFYLPDWEFSHDCKY